MPLSCGKRKPQGKPPFGRGPLKRHTHLLVEHGRRLACYSTLNLQVVSRFSCIATVVLSPKLNPYELLVPRVNLVWAVVKRADSYMYVSSTHTNKYRNKEIEFTAGCLGQTPPSFARGGAVPGLEAAP